MGPTNDTELLRSPIQAVWKQLRIRRKFAAESWLGLRPFLEKELNGHVSEARTFRAPEIDPATMLGIKLVWATAAFFRQTRPLHALYALTGHRLLDPVHARLYRRVVEACEAHGEVAREVEIPSYDWREGSPEEFHRRFVQTPHPVILRGFAGETQAVREWGFERFLERYGDEEVLLTRAEKDGYEGRFREVNDPSVYIHNCEVLFRRHPELLGQLELPKLEPYIQKKLGYTQLFVGRGGTGTPFHSAAVWNWFVMVEGKKTWYFVDPKDSVFLYPFPVMGRAASFALRLFPDQQDPENFPAFAWCPYYKATLEPGDVLLNPPWWWHAVQNETETSIGVASRWHGDGSVGQDDMMTEEDYQVSPFFSWLFQAGLPSIPFMHGILKNPSPMSDDLHTIRERKNRFTDLQNNFANGEVFRTRFRF